MFRFVLLACVLVSGLCAPSDYDELDLPVLGIVGGEVTSIDRYPYQVSLEYRSQHFCGGAIIDEYTIVTAAHCTETKFIRNAIDVRAGTSTRERGGQLIRVKQIFDHPNYRTGMYTYDISVLILSAPLRLSSTVYPIPLENNVNVLQSGKRATVSGWGHTKENGQLSTYLQKVDVPLMSADTCKKSYYGQISETMICAGEPHGTKDACQADSGGPLAMNGKLVGVVSWGIGCARAGNPGVYTNVPFCSQWIEAARQKGRKLGLQ